MTQFEIIIGSMLGATEYVAEAVKDCLTELNYQAELHFSPDINEINPENTWIICTSTHGAGDLPDNIQNFADQLANQSLQQTQYLVIGLGDSSYDTFCGGAAQIDNLMQQAGAKKLTESFHIDVLNHPIPEEVAVEWLTNWLNTHNN